MAKKSEAVNVALRQETTDCKGRHVSNVIVDGIRDPKNAAEIESQCDGRESFVEIYLKQFYNIHYVVVYAGENTKVGQLDYFNVLVTDGRAGNWLKCSEFSGRGIISDTGMRVNCEPLYGKHKGVIIQSRTDLGLSICEVEVHTLASGIPGEGLRIFRGCFKKFGSSETPANKPVFISCQVKCLRNDYIFFAIKDGRTCHCEYTYDDDDEIPRHNCSLICDDGKNFCGGAGVYSVYLAFAYLPIYKGCFVYRATPKFQDDMTVGKCLQQCDGFIYAFLQDGNTCICEDDIDLKLPSFLDKCDSKCSGDPNEFCGGTDVIAVYETCKKKQRLSLKCSKIIKCDKYDKYGHCIGSCKPGFMGEHCLKRDPSFFDNTKATTTTEEVVVLQTNQSDSCKKFNPCIGQANTKCITHRGKPKCICITGYSKDNRTDACEDIDECKYEPCDNRYAFCLNLNGSYICKCRTGYNATMSDDICLADNADIDVPMIDIDMPRSVIAILPLLSMLVMATLMWPKHSTGMESDISSTTGASADED